MSPLVIERRTIRGDKGLRENGVRPRSRRTSRCIATPCPGRRLTWPLNRRCSAWSRSLIRLAVADDSASAVFQEWQGAAESIEGRRPQTAGKQEGDLLHDSQHGG